MEQQKVVVVKTEKSIGVAYVLLILLGQLGIHRFYLGKVLTGVIQLLLGIIGWATAWVIFGFIPLAILWLWLLIDLFLIPSIVRAANDKLLKGLSV